MTIVVHSVPHCVGCTATKRKLDQLGVPYEAVDLTQESAAAFKEQGFGQAPVVVTDQGTWAGFRPDLLGKLVPAEE